MARDIQKDSVILVGNSVEILQHNYGEYIDSFDHVVRFGQGVPRKDISKSVGSKTDFWVTGWLRKNYWHHFPNAEILFNRSRIHLNVEPELELPFDDYTIMFSDEELLKIFAQIGAESNKATKGARPSAGFLGILYFLTKLKCENITLIGFDFFSKKLPISAIAGPKKVAAAVPIKICKINKCQNSVEIIAVKYEETSINVAKIIGIFKPNLSITFPIKKLPSPKPTIVVAYSKLALPLSILNSVSIAGITTTTDHIPTVPTTPIVNRSINLNHDFKLSCSIEVIVCLFFIESTISYFQKIYYMIPLSLRFIISLLERPIFSDSISSVCSPSKGGAIL